MLEGTHKCNLSLNSGKLQFKQSVINFFNQTLADIQSEAGKPDEINYCKTSSSVKELQTILGMLTYLSGHSVTHIFILPLDKIKKESC